MKACAVQQNSTWQTFPGSGESVKPRCPRPWLFRDLHRVYSLVLCNVGNSQNLKRVSVSQVSGAADSGRTEELKLI